MSREFGELIYLGLLYVVLPYQAYLETVTKVVIDDSERGGWGSGLGKSPLFCSPWHLQSLHISIYMYVRIHTCVYLIGPILVFICWRRINIRPCDEKNSIERREEKHVTGKIECVEDMAAVCLIEPPPHHHQRVTGTGLGGTWFHAHKFSTLVTYIF